MMHKLSLSLAICLSLLIHFNSFASFDFAPILSHSEKELISHVEMTIGPVLTENQLAFAEWFSPHFHGLASQQVGLAAQEGFLSVNQLFFIDSPSLDAFVYTDHQVGVKQLRASVFVTTGLLFALLQADETVDLSSVSPDELRKRFELAAKGLVGIVAHELAHPQDLLDRDGTSITIRRGAEHKQANEGKTDIEGEVMAENAGHGRGTLYTGLTRLFSFVGDTKQAPGLAFFSTHPENSFRESYLRIYQTFADQEFGEQLVSQSFTSPGDASGGAFYTIGVGDEQLKSMITDAVSFQHFRQFFAVGSPSTAEQMHQQIRSSFLELRQFVQPFDHSVGSSSEREIKTKLGSSKMTQILLKYHVAYTGLIRLATEYSMEGQERQAVEILEDLYGYGYSIDRYIRNVSWTRVHEIPPAFLSDWNDRLRRTRALGQSLLEVSSLEPYQRGFGDKLSSEVYQRVSKERLLALFAEYFPKKRGSDQDLTYFVDSKVSELLSLVSLFGPSQAFNFYREESVNSLKETIDDLKSRKIYKPGQSDVVDRSSGVSLPNYLKSPELELPFQSFLFSEFIEDKELSDWVGLFFVGAMTKERADMISRHRAPPDNLKFLPSHAGSGEIRLRYRRLVLRANTSEVAQRDLEHYRRYMKFLWLNKGLFATLQVIGYDPSEIDWYWIASFSDPSLSRTQVLQEVGNAFIEFVGADDPSQTIGHLETQLAPYFKDYKTSTPAKYGLDMLNASRVTWMTEALAGKTSRAIERGMNRDQSGAGDSIRSRVQVIFAHTYQARVERNYLSSFRQALGDINESVKISTAKISRIHQSIMKDLFGETKFSPVGLDYFSVMLEEVMHTDKLTLAQRRDWVEQLAFQLNRTEINSLRGITYWKYQTLSVRDYLIRLVYDAAVKFGLTTDPESFLDKILADESEALSILKSKMKNKPDEAYKRAVPFHRFSPTDMHLTLSALADPIVEDLRLSESLPADDQRRKLEKFSRYLLSDTGRDFARIDSVVSEMTPESNSHPEKEKVVAAVLELALRLYPSDSSKLYRTWIRATKYGGNQTTDDFFREHLLSLYVGDQSKDRATALIRQKRLKDPALKVELAQGVLAPRVDALRDQRFNDRNVFEHLQWNRSVTDALGLLTEIADVDSAERDSFLEHFAWEVGAREEVLQSLQSLKSTNWTKMSPQVMNYLSGLSAYLGELTLSERYALVRYVRNPNAKDRETLLNGLRKTSLIEARARDFGSRDGEEIAQSTRSQEANKTMAAKVVLTGLDAYLTKSTHSSRLVLLEAGLTVGGMSILNTNRGLDRLLHDKELLGYDPDSVESKFIRAYLNVTPEYSRSVILSYLLAIRNQNGKASGIVEVCKAFRYIGIKFGQNASIWELFDKKITEELAELKDDAGALDLAVIEKIFIEQLGSEAARDFEIIEVLGSASVKTVVLVRQKSTNNVYVAWVGNPHAKGQLETQLRRSQDLVGELEKMGVSSESALFSQIIDAITETAYEEIDFLIEKQKTEAFSEVIEKVGRELSSELLGWQLNVATPEMPENWGSKLGFVGLAKGVAFEDLPDSAKVPAGEVAVKVMLRMLFGHGAIEPDRHTKNQFFQQNENGVGGWINFFDAGQFKQLPRKLISADDRFHLANFLRALEAREVSTILQALNPLLKTPGAGRLRSHELSNEIENLFVQHPEPSKSFNQMLTSLVNLLAKHELSFRDEILFSVNKGIMTLYGENYVQPGRFIEILRGEVRRTLMRNPVKAIVNSCKASLS